MPGQDDPIQGSRGFVLVFAHIPRLGVSELQRSAASVRGEKVARIQPVT